MPENDVPPESEQKDNDTFEDAKDAATPQPMEASLDGTAEDDKVKKRESQADSAKALEDVSLVEETPESDAVNDQTVPSTTTSHNHTPSQDSTRSAKTRPTSITQTSEVTKLQIPELPADADAHPEPVSSPPAKRKLFGWLSRTTSSQDTKNMRVPSLSFRGTPVPNLTIAEENSTQASQLSPTNKRSSLQDRFKLVRLREEAGIDTAAAGLETEDYLGRSQSVDVAKAQEKDAAMLRTQRAHSVADPTQLPAGDISPVKPKSAQGEPVDWDLWQEVVYEGPAAVSRRSSRELNEAIAKGIPSAIRGVVWQVLAQSKDEELEETYRILVARQGGEEMPPANHRMKPKLPPRQNTQQEVQGDKRRSSTFSATLEQPETILSAESAVQSTTSESTRATSIDESMTSPSTSQGDAESAKAVMTEPTGLEEAKALDKLTISRLEKAIRRDMGTRTSYSKFLMSAGLQDGLYGICKAYALYDEDVGYAQGMNFIAMPLLFNMPEEEAFCLFVKLMNQYDLRNQFVRDMPGLHKHLYQFERVLEDLEPAVYCHLARRGVSPQLYATQWYLTLFAYRFPLQLVLRIYDLILSEGLESAILKFGIVLMQKNAEELLKMKDMVELTTFLKERLFDVYLDKSPSANSVLESGFFGSAGGIDKEIYKADALVQDACAVEVTPETLKAYTREWENKVHEEKEKEAAEEALRTNNATLTQKVRALEERAEKSDHEHVDMASELVRTKVANQQLMDENESLKMQVQQLQTIVDAQPGEVEERLRSEMDRIMTRNIEVQNENRALEESTAEMEKALVEAKMRYAEINSELESMRQKWSTMQTLMGSK